MSKNQPKKNYCEPCGKQTRDAFNYSKHLTSKTHLRIVNTNTDKHKCMHIDENGKECQYVTVTPANLRRHQLTHISDEEKYGKMNWKELLYQLSKYRGQYSRFEKEINHEKDENKKKLLEKQKSETAKILNRIIPIFAEKNEQHYELERNKYIPLKKQTDEDSYLKYNKNDQASEDDKARIAHMAERIDYEFGRVEFIDRQIRSKLAHTSARYKEIELEMKVMNLLNELH